ncbi:MAG: Era-like GTP-binding protein, partial [Leptolyngbyaceae bacterium]|nr:Era-like GTP-binding protein [Leptolyngbyaceae bacterium]
MRQVRLLLWIGGAVLVLGIALWLLGTLTQLYTAIAATSPILANFLLGLVLLVIGGLIGLAVYYGILFSRPARPKSSQTIALPSETTDVAEETLAAVQRQVGQIQDDITRQALLERSRTLSEDVNRRHFRVVVFGTGSAGKTSIVNAILGRSPGDVGAAMGTTETAHTYRFRFRNLDGDIQITDTPGLSEATVMGTEREQQARRMATESDLLIFVVDNDLRQSEYELLQQLVSIGKRSILAFNKIDLYPDDDLKLILAQLRRRVGDILSSDDVVAIAAHPQPILQPGGDRQRPRPYVLPLLRRISTILREEGKDLIADNILLQAQQLIDDAH